MSHLSASRGECPSRYTTFKYSLHVAPQTISIGRGAGLLKSGAPGKPAFPSMLEVQAAGPAASYAVNVTNIGALDADDVVLGFVVPPGAGQDGVPLQSLFGFERVHVKAGQTVTVWLYPSLTDFAVAAEDGSRTLLEGEYTVRFGVKEALAHGQGYAEATLAAHI